MCNEHTVNKTQTELNYSSSKVGQAASLEGTKLEALPKLTLDGKVVEFMPGDTIIQVAERAGLSQEIPRYCYHPGMPIAGTCRMCTVEVEKMPKLVTSCSTPAADGMIVHTKSEKVLKSRAGVMEFLLINHPLDCPVCDQAGECELQEYNFEYGPHGSEFVETKRTYDYRTGVDLSDHIKLNMNRCVYCERCVRFCEDVTKTNDLVMFNRGWKKELVASDAALGLTSDYQGCLADVCPVGALTNKDFRFEKRVWFLKQEASVCDRCSKGCNIEVHHEDNRIYRYKPLFNEAVNKHWMCDEGRLSYYDTINPSRVVSPLVNYKGQMHSTSWDLAAGVVRDLLSKSQRALVLLGTDMTLEEAQALMKQLPELFKTEFTFRSYNGTSGVASSGDDQKLDHLLRMKDKTPNTKGLESLHVTPLKEAEVASVSEKFDLVFIVRSGRTGLPALKIKPEPELENVKTILWGAFNTKEVGLCLGEYGVKPEVLLPGLMTAEKSGTFINCDGIKQSFKAAVAPCAGNEGHALSVAQILEIFSKSNNHK